MISIIKDPNIGSLYTITGNQVAELTKVPNILNCLTQNGTTPERNRPHLTNRHLVNLNNRLHQLRDSVSDYSNLCFFWKIIGIFSGTFWNYQRLQRSLSFIIKQVDTIVRKIIPQNPPTSSGGTSTRPVNPASKFTIAPVNQYNPPAQPYSPPSPLSPALPKQPPKFYTPAERIQRKIKLIDAAQGLVSEQLQGHRAQFQNDPSKLDKDIRAAFKADEFFRKTKEKLVQGIDAPLPRWFHATGNRFVYDSAKAIINQKQLVQSGAYAGFGVYLSTCDESANYGPWTFAIDESVLEGSEGYFFPAEGQHSPGFMYPALWVRVLKNIPITTDSVAFMVANANRVDELRQNILTPTNFNVDILTREEAKQVYYYLELADCTRECPSNLWEPNTADPDKRIHRHELPDNMRNRSWPRLPRSNQPVV